MSDVVAAFAELLEQERAATIRADLTTLNELQEKKRELMPRVLECRGPRIDPLIARAQTNVALIRHLMLCLRGALDISDPTYTAKGQSQAAAQPLVRGVL